MLKRSAAAIAGPGRSAIMPTGVSWATCMPKAASTVGSSSTPCVDHRLGPAGRPSSAGWKSTFTVPANSSRRSMQQPGHAEQHRGVGVVAAGVHHARRSASGSRPRSPPGSAGRPCRRAAGRPCPSPPSSPRISPVTPVLAMPVRTSSTPERAQPLGDEAGGLELLERPAPGAGADGAGRRSPPA